MLNGLLANAFLILLSNTELAGCVRRSIAGESCSQKEQEWVGRYFEFVLVFLFNFFEYLSVHIK